MNYILSHLGTNSRLNANKDKWVTFVHIKFYSGREFYFFVFVSLIFSCYFFMSDISCQIIMYNLCVVQVSTCGMYNCFNKFRNNEKFFTWWECFMRHNLVRDVTY